MQITILPASATGVKNLQLTTVSVFPSPGNGDLHISVPNDELIRIIVIDEKGAQEQFSRNYFHTALKGMLIVKVNTVKGTFTTKVVVE